MIQHLTTLERKTVEDRIRSAKGHTIAGYKVGAPLKYQGELWFFYDADADSSVAGGVTLVLVSGDCARLARDVRTDNTEKPHPADVMVAEAMAEWRAKEARMVDLTGKKYTGHPHGDGLSREEQDELTAIYAWRNTALGRMLGAGRRG